MYFFSTLEFVSHIFSAYSEIASMLAGVLAVWFITGYLARSIRGQTKALYSARHELVPAKVADFPWLDRAYYDATERELAAMGFRTLGDYEDRTMSRIYPSMRTFIRWMASRDGTVSAGIYHFRMRGWQGVLSSIGIFPKPVRCVDLETEMADGVFAVTANILGRDLSSAVQGISRVHLPPGSGVGELLAKHAEHVETLAAASGPARAAACTLEGCMEMQHRMQEVKNRAKAGMGYVDVGQFERCAAAAGNPLGSALIREQLK